MKVITWNMQGATGASAQGAPENKWNTDVKRLLLNTDVDVLLLQEAGALPATAQPATVPTFLTQQPPAAGFNTWGTYIWNVGTSDRPNTFEIYWVKSDNANRCNLAIVARHVPTMLMLVANPAGGRPALGARFAISPQVSFDVYTLHAASPGGADSRGLLDAINGVAAAGSRWAVGADFNKDPGLWAGLPYTVCPNNAAATHPGSATNLDYVIASFASQARGAVDENFVVSDHYAVHYEI